ncbi:MULTISPECIES: AvrD family protein [unclassified Nocardiopsis]|uniref:AvrD family protein n=1 Tax=unclassified Nocardiopsis TaxID=2649073 RepID=UPI00135B9A6C|nr:MULTISPECIES: AvrD family protein [unclassified Nocardiopsis]
MPPYLTAQKSISTVDEILGPGEKRFFGSGFRRVDYRYHDTKVSAEPDQQKVEVTSGMTVRYPEDWSRKGTERKIVPHFSTIDALVAAAELSELCVTGRSGNGDPETSSAWLRSVRILAGGTPMEELDRIPLRAVRRSLAPLAEDPSWSVSVVDGTVGNMRVGCEVIHRTGTGPRGEHVYSSPDDVLGEAGDRYFGKGFTSRRQEIRNVVVDPNGLRARADLSLHQDGPYARSGTGLEADYQPSVSMVDGFVTALQLAQIMLYDLDGIRREDSNTLWMRQTVLRAARPNRPAGADRVGVTTTITEPALIRMGGFPWRTGDIVGEFDGLRVTCSVAHRLNEGEDR